MANKYNPDLYRPRSIRLKGYNYSQGGAYFVTICTYDRECFLGDVLNSEMRLNEYGHAVENEWLRTNAKRPNGPIPGSISAIIGQFKSIVTKRINAMRSTSGMPVWQRNYFEHIIRNEGDMNRIREYIINNPARWVEDENNLEVTIFVT